MRNGIIEVFGIKTNKLKLFPDNIVEEIIQNITIILTTNVGSVPLDRNFGLDATFVDDPQPRAMMKLKISIVESIQKYEPRVEVSEVEYVPKPGDALDGKLYPKVRVRIKDEYLT